MVKDEQLVAQLEENHTQATLCTTDRAMLKYAAKLTLTPADVTCEDVQALRDTGFDDRSILDIALITAYFAFVNRIAHGLGVSLEGYWGEDAAKGEAR